MERPVKSLGVGSEQPKQREMMLATAKYVAYGGARGGGKSFALRLKARILCVMYPGIKVLIVRRTYKELQNNHIDILRVDLAGQAVYNSSEKRFRFHNGSTISFGYCDSDNDILQYQGAEYDVIMIDEATQLREEWLKIFPACLRGVNTHPKRIYYTCNPGGPAHGYIKRLFIDRIFREAENPDDYAFIRALVTDNAALMMAQPDYIKQLEALPYKLRQAWLAGDWTVLEGAFFEEFVDAPDHYADRRWTHVIDPFQPPRGWTVTRSFDWGFRRPFCCQWWAVDYEGTMYELMELYGQGREDNEGIKWPPNKVFSEIARIEREHPWLKGREIHGVADPSIWAVDTGVSIEEESRRAGVFWRKADNERIPGWMQCHYRLQFDEEGFPRCYFFSNCKDTIRTIQLQMYDQHKVEDLDTDLEDHAPDAWRYECMSRPIKPIIEEPPKEILIDPLDTLDRRKRRR